MFANRESELGSKLQMGWPGFMCMGTDLNDKGDCEGAISAFSEAIHICPYIAAAYSLRGQCLALMGEDQQAISDFTLSVGLDPQDQLTFIYRAICYFEIENYPMAKADIDTAFELGGGIPASYFIRGCLNMLDDLPVAAVRDFEAALALDPYDSLVRRHRLDAYQSAGKWEIRNLEGNCLGSMVSEAQGRVTVLVSPSGRHRRNDLMELLESLVTGNIEDDGMVVFKSLEMERAVDVMTCNGFVLSTGREGQVAYGPGP